MPPLDDNLPLQGLALQAPSLQDRAAWKELRATLARFVSRRVGARDAEDVLQEVFVRISRGLPDLREGERLSAWVHQIARNTIVDHYRRPLAQREPPNAADAAVAPGAADDDPAAVTELTSVLTDFVQLLSPLYREALELTELQRVTQAEAARRLGLSVPGMKSRVQRARAQLRDLLDSCCDIELDVRGRIVDCEPRQPPLELPTCCVKPRK